MTLLVKPISEEFIIERIQAAQSSVALYAAGVSENIAAALCQAAEQLCGNVKVALDVSRKSIEMGFLDKRALSCLWKCKCEETSGRFGFYFVAGIRLCSLFVDDGPVLVYPALSPNFEEGNMGECLACPNSFLLDAEEIDVNDLGRDIAQEPVTVEMVKSLCDDMNDVESKTLAEIRQEQKDAGREEGLRESAEKVDAAERRAEEAVAQKEEAVAQAEEARKESDKLREELAKKKEEIIADYEKNAKIRRVEFSVTECLMSGCNLALPAEYLSKRDAVRSRLKARYQLFDKDEKVDATVDYEFNGKQRKCTLGYFAMRVKEIRQNLVFSAGPTFGNFVFGDDIKALEEAVAELKVMAEALKKKLPEAIREKADKKIDDLFKDVYPIMKAKPSDELREMINCVWAGLSGKELMQRMKEYFIVEMQGEIDKATGFFAPEIVFGETIYPLSTLRDSKFREAVKKGLKRSKKHCDLKIDEIFDSIPAQPTAEKAGERMAQ